MRRLTLTLLACALPLVAAAQEASVRITNRGTRDIQEIYVASAGVNAWGDDRLGSKTLGSGASHLVPLPPGQCVNDIRIVFDGGEAKERRRINTCSQGDLVFP
ncbi:hypothetical protein JMJ55_23420 [Belnapia sp. T6]|uniref:Uncharacterized protein n=1 Tax=Belnapia mucosa TaxID=2804532 RepID=A0ABS1V9G5_9PROT|nr:hypothetical protein [Belnapia mucosa]MBL6458293.1 hypothetical protein [Belnapia mucosa]